MSVIISLWTVASKVWNIPQFPDQSVPECKVLLEDLTVMHGDREDVPHLQQPAICSFTNKKVSLECVKQSSSPQQIQLPIVQHSHLPHVASRCHSLHHDVAGVPLLLLGYRYWGPHFSGFCPPKIPPVLLPIFFTFCTTRRVQKHLKCMVTRCKQRTSSNLEELT